MIDPNKPEPPRKRSFFEEEEMEDTRDMPPRSRPPFQEGRERMASRYHEEEEEYEDDYEPRDRAVRPSFFRNILRGGGEGSSTRYLVYAATGIGALLVFFIGGWMISHSSHNGIPVFDQPKQAAKEKPIQDNNMNTIGMDQSGQVDANGQPVLAPAPEQANPSALAAQLNSASQNSAGQNSNAQNLNGQKPAGQNPASAVPPPVMLPNGAQSSSQPNPASSPNGAASTVTGTATDDLPLGQDMEATESTPAPAVKKTQPVKKPSESAHRVAPKKAVTAGKATEQAAGSGHFGVQLAALGSASAAQKQWQDMRRKAPALLGKYSPSIQKADVKGHVIYRIRIRGFASSAQASHFCSGLKAKGVSCTLANF